MLPSTRSFEGFLGGLESSDGKEKKQNRPASRGLPQRASAYALGIRQSRRLAVAETPVTMVIASSLWLGRAGSGSLLTSY